MSIPVTERSALELAAAIRSREVTARAVVDAHIELIERENPRVNAIVATRFVRRTPPTS
jgi:amidase